MRGDAIPLRVRARAALWGDGPLGFATRARQRRMQLLAARIPDLAGRRVLDLRGTLHRWKAATARPMAVCCINLGEATSSEPGFSFVRGDTTSFPDLVELDEFDLVYSDSLLEHLGGTGARRRLADAIARSGLGYWVQAPYRHFPLEPHWALPFWQYVPRRWQVPLGARFRYGSTSTGAQRSASHDLSMLDLPTVTDTRFLFPDAQIVRKRVFGLTKSLIAVRT